MTESETVCGKRTESDRERLIQLMMSLTVSAVLQSGSRSFFSAMASLDREIRFAISADESLAEIVGGLGETRTILLPLEQANNVIYENESTCEDLS